MAAERVRAEQAEVEREYDRADAHAECAMAGRVGKPERIVEIVREDEQKRDRDVEEVAVNILEYQREKSLAQIRRARLAHRAVDRIRPHRLVVRAAIVVAGEPESARRPEDQKRGRERKNTGPPAGLRTEPCVRRIAEEFGRIEGREVGAGGVVVALKGGPRGIANECREDQERYGGLQPPCVGSGGLEKLARRE